MRSLRSRLQVRKPRPVALLVAPTLGALLLSACGGGSDGTASASIDDSTATAYSADAAVIPNDAMGGADTAILTAQNVVASLGTVTAAESKSSALSADAKPLTTSAAVTRTCAGGGTATVSISGANTSTWNNGKFDTGETYQISFAACKGFAGWVTVDGSMTLAVDSASGDSSNGNLALTLNASNLTVATPRGSASLNGSATRELAVSTDANGVVHLSGHYVASSITWSTQYFGRTSTFTLSAVDIQRDATISGGLLQSSSVNGTHTLSATLPNGSFSYTVATNGAATYDANGVPTSGNWTITLPENLITLTIGNGNATWTLDRGKDGTIDRTVIVPLPQFTQQAG